MPAALGLERFLETEVEEGIEVRVGNQEDGPSGSAVAAVRSAARDELLPAEADHALPAVTGFNVNFCFVYEFHILHSRYSGLFKNAGSDFEIFSGHHS